MDSLQGKCILVIDDEPDLLQFVSIILTREGAHVVTAKDGNQGLDLLHKHHPDLVLLDIMMPGLPGFETCSRITDTYKTPVIFLTALAAEDDIVNGLNLGAVDYITKPFTPKVLIARIQAALRFLDQTKSLANTRYDDGYLGINLADRHITVNGDPVRLTLTEYKLLVYLYSNANRVTTFADILANVWGPEYESSSNYVHIYTWRLRQKIEKDPANPQYVRSEPGSGYRFTTTSSA